MNDNMTKAAIELDTWLRFAGCAHLGYISTAVGADLLIIYWDKTHMVPGGMPESFHDFPLKVERIGRPIPLSG